MTARPALRHSLRPGAVVLLVLVSSLAPAHLSAPAAGPARHDPQLPPARAGSGVPLPTEKPDLALVSAVNNSTEGWQRIPTSGAPSARSDAAMVYDPAEGYVLLFGGSGINCTGVYPYTCHDTWTYLHGVWTELNLSVAPGPRDDALIAYDAADRCVVLFGGEASWIQNGQLTARHFNDTWTFQNGSWTNVTPTFAPPSGDSNVATAGMAFDSEDGYVLYAANVLGPTGRMFPGIATWMFRGGSWSELPTNLPGGPQGTLEQGAMVDDPALGLVALSSVLVPAGTSALGIPQLSPTWWGYHGGTWSLLDLPGTYWYSFAPAYIPNAHGLVAYASTADARSNSSGTWFLQGLRSWDLNLSPMPSARFAPSVAYDVPDGYLLLFGGAIPSSGILRQVNESWEFGLGSNAMLPLGVRVEITPARCGPLFWDSIPVENGTLLLTDPGPHHLDAPPCPFVQFDSWATTGGVAADGYTGNVSVEIAANGTLLAEYLPVYSVEVLVEPSTCGEVLVGGMPQVNGSLAVLPMGRGVSIVAPDCGAHQREFEQWNASPGVSLGGLGAQDPSWSIHVFENGTLVARYVPLPGGSTAASSSSGEWAAIGLAAGLGIGGLIVAVALRRRAPPPPPSGVLPPEGSS